MGHVVCIATSRTCLVGRRAGGLLVGLGCFEAIPFRVSGSNFWRASVPEVWYRTLVRTRGVYLTRPGWLDECCMSHDHDSHDNDSSRHDYTRTGMHHARHDGYPESPACLSRLILLGNVREDMHMTDPDMMTSGWAQTRNSGDPNARRAREWSDGLIE